MQVSKQYVVQTAYAKNVKQYSLVQRMIIHYLGTNQFSCYVADQVIDEESCLLLDEGTIASLIPKIGTRLKFQKHYKEFVSN